MSNRTYSAAFNENKSAPNFPYIYDPGAFNSGNPNSTGAWRPYSTTDIGSVSISGLNLTVGAVAVTGNPNMTVSNTAPIPVSGVVAGSVIGVDTGVRAVSVANPVLAISGFVNTVVTGAVSASFDTTPIVNAQTTGNNYLADISGRLNNTLGAPINVSGVVSTSVTVGNVTVTGFPATIAPLAVSGSFSASINQVAITGNGAFDPVVRGLLTGISGLLASNLTVISTVTGWNTGIKVRTEPVSTTSVSNSTPSGASPFTGTTFFFGQALAANPNRVMMFVQNIHTGIPLYVNLGAAAASTGAFSFILNPSASLNYGGSSFADDHYRGAVQVSGGAWQAWEM
jgi:hypothetical protein